MRADCNGRHLTLLFGKNSKKGVVFDIYVTVEEERVRKRER